MRTFLPVTTNADGTVHGPAGVGSPEDHAAAAKWAAEERERQGPLLASEEEICKLLGLPPYDETDYMSPWVHMLALGFPRPNPRRITTDPYTRKDTYAPLEWYKQAVRQFLEHYDAVTATIQRPEKRHRYFR